MRIPRAGYVQEMSIFIAEKLQTSPGIQYRKCANSLTRIEASSLQIHCLSERGYNGVPGRFLHIRDERKVHDFYFAICEIEVYVKEGTFFFSEPSLILIDVHLFSSTN